jgi:hypothetical protein
VTVNQGENLVVWGAGAVVALVFIATVMAMAFLR